MRHRSDANNFNRHPAHRRAMMRNMVMNLFEHGRIRTTLQKAKAARRLAENVITLGKKGTVHHRRQAISKLGGNLAAKRSAKKVFGEISERFAERAGGYTRILKLPKTIRQAQSDLPRGVTKRSKFYGTRLGDNATLVLFELCEAEIQKKEKPKKKAKAAKSKKPKKEKSESKPKAESKEKE